MINSQYDDNVIDFKYNMDSNIHPKCLPHGYLQNQAATLAIDFDYIPIEKIKKNMYKYIYKSFYYIDKKIYPVVIKCLNTKTIKINDIVNEIQILKKISKKDYEYFPGYSNILRYYNNVSLYIDNNNNNYVGIITEYIDGIDLQQYLKNNKISNHEIYRIFKQLSYGLNYIHTLGFAHRDLKPENIMVINTNNKIYIKIIDFGLSCNKNNDISFSGTIYYIPPEYFVYKKTKFDLEQPHDIWSLGIILYQMIYNFHPLENNYILDRISDIRNIFYKYKSGEYQIYYNNNKFDHFIKFMLVYDYNERIKASCLVFEIDNYKNEIFN